MDCYLVGGVVRDRLLGVPVSDRDWVVVGGSAEALLAQGFRQVGADFPVFLHPDTGEEYALARTERKSGHGYKGFVTDAADVTLEEDLARRDFTINAMAMTASGEVIDPYGGRRDLAAGVLRHVTAAFAEDPLRILRGARFAARFGFSIAPETLALMQAMSASGELATLAPERVWQELRRALGEPHPDLFFRVLRSCGALVALLPEVEALFGVPQPAAHHPEIDTGEHVLLTLVAAAQADAPETVRFALLVHDLGKGTTPPAAWPHHVDHETRGVALIETLCARLRVPRAHRELACLVARLHTRVHRALELKPATIVRLLETADAWRRSARFEELLLACTLDARGRQGRAQAPYPQAARLRDALAVTATPDVAALRADGLQGPALAAAIHAARIELLKRSGI